MWEGTWGRECRRTFQRSDAVVRQNELRQMQQTTHTTHYTQLYHIVTHHIPSTHAHHMTTPHPDTADEPPPVRSMAPSALTFACPAELCL